MKEIKCFPEYMISIAVENLKIKEKEIALWSVNLFESDPCSAGWISIISYSSK